MCIYKHGIQSHHFMSNRWGNSGNKGRLYFLGSKITADGDGSHEIKRRLLLGRKVMTNLDSILKSRDITLSTKARLVSGHVRMWELDYKENSALKDWCSWIVLSVKTLESPLDCREIQPVHPKGNQSWIFIGKTDAESPILWPPDVKNWLLGRKVMTNLDSILKSRDITLPTKFRLVKAMVFTVVMYGCESLTVKKAESRRIDAFELWCWRRLLSVPWTARRSNQSILKEISPGCSLEGLMLKLKL